MRSLSNPSGGAWPNENTVQEIPGVAWYALVLTEDFTAIGVAMLPLDRLAPIAAALGKKHGTTDTTLQFARVIWLAIRDDPDRFRALGARDLSRLTLKGDVVAAGMTRAVGCSPAIPYRRGT